MKETAEFLEENFFVSHPFLLFVMHINLTEIKKLRERERKKKDGKRGNLCCLLAKNNVNNVRIMCKIRKR